MRPQVKARRFSATAVPFSSIARSSASWPTGISPACQASPVISVFSACDWPNSFSDKAVARRYTLALPPTARSITRRCSPASITRSRLVRNCVLACKSRLPSTAPPRRIRSSTPFCAPTAKSAAIIRSASPVGMRTTSSPSCAICTWEMTAPFFCASPVKSSVLTCLPSMLAAIATTAPAVTMPPPPMPANNPRHGVARSGSTGSVSPAASSSSRARQACASSCFGASVADVTKEGQNPFRQDRSVLQLVGEMRRLRPYSVSTGSMAMQWDCAVQSPQFSHTRVLMLTFTSACTMVPRLRRRRFSVAQTWS